jgi:hypothetical protein
MSKRNAYILHPNGGTKTLSFYIYDSGSSHYVPYTSSKDLTQWHHYIGTYNGATLKIYEDGVLMNSVNYTGNIDLTTDNLYIGLDNCCGGRYFNGNIDEAVIYDKALTATEVEERYLKYGAEMSSLTADDNSGGVPGIQAGDTVTIVFNAETNAPTIDASNIDTVLALNNGHSWLDGSGAIGSVVWSTTTETNDTLTITLSDTTNVPTIEVGDSVALDETTIANKYGDPILGSGTIGGSF